MSNTIVILRMHQRTREFAPFGAYIIAGKIENKQ